MDDIVLRSPDLELYTDACQSIGFASVFRNAYFYGLFPPWWKQQNITLLELYPIMLSVEVWVDKFRNRRICFHTDNRALVSVINKQTSKEELVMVLIRRMVLFCLLNNIVVTAEHIPGKLNVASDALSRQNFQVFHGVCPDADPSPVAIPRIPEKLI